MRKKLAFLLCILCIVPILSGCIKRNVQDTPSIDRSSSSEPIPEPIPEPEPYYASPLSGIEKDIDYPINQRVAAFMVNNRRDGLPHSGVSEAAACYEMVTEGGITRYMLVFDDYTKIPRIGPIRSARDPHVQFMAPLNALYIHDGGSTMALQMLKDLDWSNGDFTPGKSTFRRSRPGKSMDETEYTNAEYLINAASDERYATEGAPKLPIVRDGFVHYDDMAILPTDGSALKVKWSFSQSYDGNFEYNTATNRYEKSQFGMKLLDENNGQPFAFENLLVLFTEIKPYGNTVLRKVELGFGGVGYYFYGGSYQKILWRKGGPLDALAIYTLDGSETPVLLNVGKTYVGVVGLEFHDTTFKIFGISNADDGNTSSVVIDQNDLTEAD